jgi:hypothetical protein
MSFEERRDHRTTEEMAEDIDQYTEKEFYFGIAYRYDLCQRGFPCKIEEHGVDNTGVLIPGRLPNHNVDKIYHFRNGMNSLLIEIKTIPKYCKNKMTFKVSALRQCLKQEGYILVPKANRYYLFGSRSFKRMLSRCDVVTNLKQFGYKPCVVPSISMINQMVYEEMVIKKDWSPKALDYVRRMDHILFAERRTNGNEYIHA